MNVDNLPKFYEAQLRYIKESDPSAKDILDGEPMDAYQTELHNQWLDTIGGTKTFDFMSLPEACQSFQVWLVEEYLKQAVAHQEYIEVFVQRSWGAVTAGVRIGGKMDVTTSKSRSASIDYLWRAAEFELDRYGADRLKDTPANPPYSQGQGASGAGGYEDMIGEKITVEVKDGKQFFKVHGGKWQKHGVRVWPEVLKAIGLDPSTIPATGRKLADRVCKVKMKPNGQPDKVVSIKVE